MDEARLKIRYEEKMEEQNVGISSTREVIVMMLMFMMIRRIIMIIITMDKQ